jgi:hypothetical protein
LRAQVVKRFSPDLVDGLPEWCVGLLDKWSGSGQGVV